MTQTRNPSPSRGARVSASMKKSRGFHEAAKILSGETGIDYLIAFMEGYVPRLVKDARYEDGYRVDRRVDEAVRATPEQQMWAWTQWRLARYGQPVANHVIDAAIRSSGNDAGVSPEEVRALTPEARRAVREALAMRLVAPGGPSIAVLAAGAAEVPANAAVDVVPALAPGTDPE